MQSSNTRELVFDVPTLIAWITQGLTLEPGDIILTGTPGASAPRTIRRAGSGTATSSRSRSAASAPSAIRSCGSDPSGHARERRPGGAQRRPVVEHRSSRRALRDRHPSVHAVGEVPRKMAREQDLARSIEPVEGLAQLTRRHRDLARHRRVHVLAAVLVQRLHARVADDELVLDRVVVVDRGSARSFPCARAASRSRSGCSACRRSTVTRPGPSADRRVGVRRVVDRVARRTRSRPPATTATTPATHAVHAGTPTPSCDAAAEQPAHVPNVASPTPAAAPSGQHAPGRAPDSTTRTRATAVTPACRERRHRVRLHADREVVVELPGRHLRAAGT